jgi:CRISPR system Cascade subunit CasB
MSDQPADYAALHGRFHALPPGAQASIKRAESPDDLRQTPGLYRLFPGARPSPRQVRLAFLLPWCPNQRGAKPASALFADEISEERIIHIARTPGDEQQDVILFRRIVRQLHPAVGWLDVAETLWYWGPKAKRTLVEDFYIALHKLDKGATA